MKHVVIYLDKEKRCTQVIRPSSKFIGDWANLVQAVTHGNYYSYEVM